MKPKRFVREEDVKRIIREVLSEIGNLGIVGGAPSSAGSTKYNVGRQDAEQRQNADAAASLAKELNIPSDKVLDFYHLKNEFDDDGTNYIEAIPRVRGYKPMRFTKQTSKWSPL